MSTFTHAPPTFLYAADFFKTNRIFTDENQKLIRQHLDNAEANLIGVQRLIQDAIDEDPVEYLSRKKAELTDCIERCRVALAPIKKLPDDILRHIFTISYPGPTNFLGLYSASPTQLKPFLITICSTCVAWRSVAIETPSLWSQMTLSCGRALFEHTHSDVEEAVKLWFTRANTYPISLTTNFGACFSKPNLLGLAEQAITLTGRSRYRKLILRSFEKGIDFLFGNLSQDQLWPLEELYVARLASPPPDPDLLSPSLATTLPSLKELRASYDTAIFLGRFMPFPSLQRLYIKTTMSLVWELIQHSPLLESCDIEMISTPTDSVIRSQLANSATCIMLSRLRSLRIMFVSAEDCCVFIEKLVLSSLECLYISALENTTFKSHDVERHVVALSQRSNTPKIGKIHFCRNLVPDLNAGILLRSLPHLKMMKLWDGCIILDDETIEGLAMGTIGPIKEIFARKIKGNAAALTAMFKRRKELGLTLLIGLWGEEND